VLRGFLKAVNKVSEVISEQCEIWLGRRRLGVKAFIPQELMRGTNPLPRIDQDSVALTAYRPEPVCVAMPRATPFRSLTMSVFFEEKLPSSEIDISCLGEILEMPAAKPYEKAFDVLSTELNYTQKSPIRPPAIRPPPTWTPWRPAFGEPSFAPPLWTGWLSFLNGFVIIAHKTEQQNFDQALARKTELLALCERRNLVLAELAKNAQSAFENAVARQEKSFELAKTAWEADAALWQAALKEERDKASALRDGASATGAAGLCKRVELTMASISWPPFVSSEGETKFDAESGIIIHEHRFPDPSSIEWVKWVALKSGDSKKPANQKEKRDGAARLHPSLCLRLAAELARLDEEDIVKAVAINGWADYIDRATGHAKRAFCASLFATKEQILSLNLSALNPVDAFNKLKGISARSLELVPVAPIRRLDTSDPRFIDSKDVLSKMTEGENIASMDWEEFEHLCRELFERAFAGSGAEVKVTQASRDQGVDAVVFDPDPLRGGKTVIQAKRYTNIVDVSAVRDLYGAVINEGAVKGILVTTSHFGPESYSFAKDKPITLLNGNELLGLLEKHGYKFRIDLAEAKSRIND
jgi:restriction system protein